ncbi:MAG: Rpp14/Pop5 family protein [Candidatus Woesearchaeota archaeon]
MPKKIKGLAPSLREKKRYLRFEILTLDNQKLFLTKPMNEVIKKLREILGVFDSADAGIVPIKYEAKLNQAIIRVSTRSLDKIKAAFLFITTLGTQEVIIKSLKVSGNINKVMEE